MQKHDVTPNEFMENGFDEDDSEIVEQLNTMGGLCWELCGIVTALDGKTAKFFYKRGLPLEK